jgi:AraC-like DNA-binding protein
MKPFRYYELPPPPALACHVMSFWGFDVRLPAGASHLHHVWPDGCVSLSVAIAAGAPLGVAIIGPTTTARRVEVEGAFIYRGMRLRPEAGKAILGFSPLRLRDSMMPLDDSALAAAVAESPVDAYTGWITPRLCARPDDAVCAAVELAIASHGGASVAAMADAARLGVRQLQRRFVDAVGITPKEYARIRRVRSTLAAVLRGERSLAALAHDLGFADQAHMTRELGDVTGLTPTSLEDRLDRIDHENVTP